MYNNILLLYYTLPVSVSNNPWQKTKLHLRPSKFEGGILFVDVDTTISKYHI